jgi:thioesterase domain-containing protein
MAKALTKDSTRHLSIVGVHFSQAKQYHDQFRDFKQSATRVVNALRTFQPQGPYSLAGYSYGGLMAYEVACQLTEMGEEVDLLAVVDTGPGRKGRKPQSGEPFRIFRFGCVRSYAK